MVKSTVVDNETGKSIDSTVRTSTGTFFARQARARPPRAPQQPAPRPGRLRALLSAAAPSTPSLAGRRRGAFAGGTASAECPGPGARPCRRVRWDGLSMRLCRPLPGAPARYGAPAAVAPLRAASSPCCLGLADASGAGRRPTR